MRRRTFVAGALASKTLWAGPARAPAQDVNATPEGGGGMT